MKQETPTKKHGGAGRGQGRPARENGPKKPRSLSLDDKQHEYIQSIGGIVKVINSVLPEELRDKGYKDGTA